MMVYTSSHCQCDSHEANNHLLSVEQAQDLAVEIAPAQRQQQLVTLGDALGRIAAKDLYAPRAMPFFDNSAMDGYAVSLDSIQGKGPCTLPVIGESAAGISEPQKQSPDLPVHAVRIFTGAPVPKGFDAVLAQENCVVKPGFVTFKRKPEKGSNIRFQGSDMKRGACLMTEGTPVQPHHIGLLAACGYSAVNVFAKPKVAVFSTGDELVRPGEKLAPGQIYDSNKPLLIALLASGGIEAVDLGYLPDDPKATRNVLSKCRGEYDLVISTGSVSVGERDFLKTAFEAVGGTIRNWKVAVKPGKPVMFGKLGSTVFMGLPGNPFAVFVGYELFVKPQLQKLAGCKVTTANWQFGIADFRWKRKLGRAEVFPIRRANSSDSDENLITRLGQSVSATLFPLSQADGLAIIPSDCEIVEPGDRIKWQPFCLKA